jgi:hypothetical protein
VLAALVTVLWLVAIAVYLYGAWWFLKKALGSPDRWVPWLAGMALWTCLAPFALIVIGVFA